MKKRQLNKLLKKAVYSEIGLTGQGVTAFDENNVKRYGRLHPRHRGLLKPIIEAEKVRRKACFRQACIEVIGEDPETDWT